VYLYAREGSTKPHGAAFTPDKIHWFKTEYGREKWIVERIGHPRKGTRKYSIQEKFGSVVCQCGCGQSFLATWKTRPPAYLDDKHHNRAMAAKRAAARAAKMKAALAEQKKRARIERLRKAGKPENAARLRKGEKGRMLEGGGMGALPPPFDTEKGMYATEPEPDKTSKRRKAGLLLGVDA
jgi:hypothetical protein